MIRTIWRSIKRLLARALRKRRSPQGPMAELILHGISNSEYTAPSLQLLAKLAQGDERVQVETLLILRFVERAELTEWIRKFERFLHAAVSKQTLLEQQQLRRSTGHLSRVAKRSRRELMAAKVEKMQSQAAQTSSEDNRPQPTKKDTETWVQRGDQLTSREDYRAAIACYDRALTIQPDDHEVWCSRGSAFHALRNYEAAIENYDCALAIKFNYGDAWFYRGIALRDLGYYEAGIINYDCALATNLKDDSSIFHWRTRSEALWDLGYYEAAVANYDCAIAINKDSSLLDNIWMDRGVALNNLGDYEAAIASYDRVIASYDRVIAFVPESPDDYGAWYYRAGALNNLGDYEAAIASCDRALARRSNFHQAWELRGIAAGNSNGQLKSLVAFSLPPEMQNLDLDKRGYEGRLASVQEGFSYFPEENYERAFLHIYLGNAHRDQARRSASPRFLWWKAATSYKNALQILTPDRSPLSYLDVLEDLISVLLRLEETDEALALQRDGSDLLMRLLSSTLPRQEEQSLPFKQLIFDQVSVDVMVQAESPIEALQLAEHGKNTYLQWMLEIDNPPEVTYTEIQEWLPPTTALVYWHLSPSALTTFVILPGYDRPKTTPPPISISAPYAATLDTDKPDQRPTTLDLLREWQIRGFKLLETRAKNRFTQEV